MAATTNPQPSSTLSQLASARLIALNDPNNYAHIVPALLSLIGTGSPLEQRRWGAEFLAETFASPVLPGDQKQQLVVNKPNGMSVLDVLVGYLTKQDEDLEVIKSAVQAASSVYPFVFRHT
jgi:symplekin